VWDELKLLAQDVAPEEQRTARVQIGSIPSTRTGNS
jgi:hypothetical protein